MDVRRTGRPVVVGVDGSGSAVDAVRWAAREAERRRAPLRLVHASGWLPGGTPAEVGLGPEYGDTLIREAREWVEDAARVAERETPGIDVQQQVLTGYPVALLTAESRLAQLVVIGDRGLGGVTGLLVGSVAVGLAARGACPVVVVRGRAGADSEEGGPVVVGVDGSAVSEAALAFAVEAAAARRAPLLAVHVWLEAVVDPAAAAVFDWHAIEQEEQAVLAERLAGWAEKYPDVAMERLVTRGGAPRVLVEQSARARLVVVGSRGRGGLAGLVLGSVSHALLHRSECPVAVVRPDVGGSR
jgi:nucleotide-binding universal stress UspA family protein